MKKKEVIDGVPACGAALLVSPKATPEQVAKVVVLGITGYSEVLRRGGESFIYRLAADPTALVFLEPAPQQLVDLCVDLLGAKVETVQLEELDDLIPVFRLSPAGIRLYVGPGLGGPEQLRH